jgi:hypothetical protein
MGFIREFALPVASACLMVFLLALPFMIKTSSVEARIYNERYGTKYTTSDFFWGSSQINEQTQTFKIEQ